MRFTTALSILAFSPFAHAVDTLVDLGYSKYQGSANGNGVSQWLGIRFAAPPLGPLRFKRPADPLHHDGIQQADKHSKTCLATDFVPDNKTFAVMSEDCLFLDVYAPSNATRRSKLPVYVFIQGGGFISNSNAKYNGSGLVQAGDGELVVVTFNYRVGPYGFLSSNTAGNRVTANNGLWDQVKVLEWVQRHIARFGGDPRHVVIGGDSAGAASVAYHLTRDRGRDHGLFVGASAESVSSSTLLTVDQSQYLYDSFAIRAGCAVEDSLECLRALSIADLQAANVNVQPYPGSQHPPLFAWNAAIDGDFIQELPHDAFRRGHFVRVPVIMGDDTDGGSVFVPKNTTTLAQLNTFMRDQFPYLTLGDLEKLDGLYPNKDETCPSVGCRFRQITQMYGQMRYMCPGLFVNHHYATHGVRQSWAYRWNVQDKGQLAQGIGVPHTVEVHAIFGPNNTRDRAPKSYYSGEVNAHSVTVAQGYWTSFIRTLNPNTYRAADSVEWKPYSPSRETRVVVNTGGKTAMEDIDSHLKEACDFMAKIAPRLRM